MSDHHTRVEVRVGTEVEPTTLADLDDGIRWLAGAGHCDAARAHLVVFRERATALWNDEGPTSREAVEVDDAFVRAADAVEAACGAAP
ncbi:MAG: hypothetical protein H6733_01630 [Alphaproteobacteria bacterium]|nr:hypothetical protein [Alphaproteobacteria bacterium]